MLRDLERLLDPVAFARDVGLEKPDPWQLEVLLASGARRILLNVHRQGGKTVISCILGLHSILYDEAPSLAVALAPSLRQSTELVRTAKGMLARLEGAPEVVLDSLTRIELANGSRLIALPGAGAGDTIRGLSAVRTLIVDEASRCSRELIAAALPMTAVAGPEARVIGLSTPAGRHADNWFFQQWHHGEGWFKVRYTGEENARIDKSFLEQQRRELGELLYRQEWLCEFVDDNTAAFSSELIEKCFRHDVRPLFAA